MSRSGMHGALTGLDARVKTCFIVAFMVAVFWAHSALSLGLLLAFSCALAAAARVDGRGVLLALKPFAVIAVFAVVMQVALYQQGPIVAQIGPVALTAQALAQTAFMLARLAALLLASVAFARCTDATDLSRSFDWALAPLRAFGISTNAATFTLSVAFRFVPVLVGDFRQLRAAQEARFASFEGGVRDRLNAYIRLFPPLVRSSFRRADKLAEASVARCLLREGKPTALYHSHVGLSEVAALVIALACIAVSIVC